jgi:hypothetical protein
VVPGTTILHLVLPEKVSVVLKDVYSEVIIITSKFYSLPGATYLSSIDFKWVKLRVHFMAEHGKTPQEGEVRQREI